jgi:hypothetical protein
VVTAPTITAPTTTGLVAASSFPDISWTAVADAVRYELWVNNLTTGAARVIYKTDLTSTTYRELAAMGSGTFRAFARAANSVNEYGNWSAGKEFTVLAPPTITRPEFTSTFDTTPLFQWTAVVGAKFYDLYVSNRATGAVVLRDQAVIGTSRNTTADIPRGDYAVWVRAVGEKFLSVWSPVKNFSIGGAPTLLNPAANAVVSANHTFSWTTVGDAGKYEIWVERASDRKVFYQNNIAGTSFRFATPFTADVYRVWLRAVSVIGDRSVWSAPVTFSVAGVDEQDVNNPEVETLLAALPEPVLTPEPQRVRTVSRLHGEQAQAAEAVQAAVIREVPEGAVAEGSQQEVRSLDRVMEDWSGTASWLEFMTDPTGVSEVASGVDSAVNT